MLCCCAGKIYYEVEVVQAHGAIHLRFGFVGSNFKNRRTNLLADIGWFVECRPANQYNIQIIESTSGPQIAGGPPLRVGDVVCVACDIENGSIEISVNGPRGGHCSGTAFSQGACPDQLVGSGLFPVIGGLDGCTVSCNLGQTSFKFPAPFDSRGYVSVLSSVRERRRAAVNVPCAASLQFPVLSPHARVFPQGLKMDTNYHY
jgi:hypothetical protein